MIDNILMREHELNAIVFERLSNIENLKILSPEQTDRLGVFSFYIVAHLFTIDLLYIETRQVY